MSGYVFHDKNGLNPGEKFKTPVILLEPNFYGHPSAGLIWERQSEEVLLHRKQGLFFLSVYVDHIKKGWREAEYGSHVEEIDEKCGH